MLHYTKAETKAQTWCPLKMTTERMICSKKQGSDHLAPGTLILRLFAPDRFDIGNFINEDCYKTKQNH